MDDLRTERKAAQSINAANSSGVPDGKASFRKSRKEETRTLSNLRVG
jgi:hypothetical protein